MDPATGCGQSRTNAQKVKTPRGGKNRFPKGLFLLLFLWAPRALPILAGRQGQCPNFAMSKCFKNRNVVNHTEYRYDVFSQISSPLTTGSQQPPALPTPLSMTSTARHTAPVLGGRHWNQEEAKSKSAWLICNTTPPRLFNPPSLPPTT